MVDMQDTGPVTTVTGVVMNLAPYAIAVRGQVYEADDTLALAPALGATVLADWLPSSGQYIIVAVVP